ncbi:MAG: ATP-binding protein [Bacteroidales bacterium]|nr:ATP-binding protein [Bacteroidales bacterium]
MENAQFGRRYPIGIQTFSVIREGGYVYIDKTDLVWKLAHEAKYIFLSRPRRFGKSLLSTTLVSYFQGRKDLFEDLKIMKLEQEWETYPVLHFDLSGAKHLPINLLKDELGRQLEVMECDYGANAGETSPGMRLAGLIRRSYEQTGRQVVVIIDEYDAPLLDVLHDDGRLEVAREVMQEFYQRLKMSDPYLRFCFITGITKFSQLSIFSTINNLLNVSMQPEYAAICGITETEFATDMAPDIAMLALKYGCTAEEMRTKLKQQYDGYRFSEDSPDIYNPFSLLKCFTQKKIDNYWFDSGTPTFLIRQMQHFRTDITTMDDMEVPSTAFDRPTEAMTTALPLLYQTGYLTIKGYDRDSMAYTLGIPNQEVRLGFVDGLLPTYIGLDGADVQMGFALKFWRALRAADLDLALREMQAYLAGLPYIEGFKKKLDDISNAEGFYEWSFYLIFNMLNVYAKTQVKCAGGRIDMVVYMPDTVYVFELKVNGTAEEALKQIDTKGYAIAYQTDGRKVVKAGVSFSTESKTIKDWVFSVR